MQRGELWGGKKLSIRNKKEARGWD